MVACVQPGAVGAGPERATSNPHQKRHVAACFSVTDRCCTITLRLSVTAAAWHHISHFHALANGSFSPLLYPARRRAASEKVAEAGLETADPAHEVLSDRRAGLHPTKGEGKQSGERDDARRLSGCDAKVRTGVWASTSRGGAWPRPGPGSPIPSARRAMPCHDMPAGSGRVVLSGAVILRCRKSAQSPLS